MAKPTDFFVGVTDLFSIVLPGAALTFVALRIEEHCRKDLLGLLQLQKEEGYIAFFVVAYLLGHVTDMIGASLIDNVYDLTYANWKQSYPLSFQDWCDAIPRRLKVELQHWGQVIFLTRESKPERPEDDLFRAAKNLAGTEKPQGINVYKWARTWTMIKSAAASTKVERLQANSKFFRGMVTVSGITCICSFVLQSPFTSVGAWACLLFTFASFLRYSDLRSKAVQQTYGFFIALRSVQKRAHQL
jgi:hypothetical protein